MMTTMSNDLDCHNVTLSRRSRTSCGMMRQPQLAADDGAVSSQCTAEDLMTGLQSHGNDADTRGHKHRTVGRVNELLLSAPRVLALPGWWHNPDSMPSVGMVRTCCQGMGS